MATPLHGQPEDDESSFQDDVNFILYDHLDITPRDDREKEVKLDDPITWRWDIVASERGPHLLSLNITAYVRTRTQGG